MKSGRWSKIRAICQLLIWVVFILIIIASRDTTDNTFFSYIPRISPLLGLSVSLTAKAVEFIFWPALIFLGLGLIFGRYFCGWICPMGSTIDAADKPLEKIGKKASHSSGVNKYRNYKYALLLILIILSLFGVQIAGIFDPLSLSIRAYGTVIFAYIDSLLKLIFNGLYYVPGLNIISEFIYSFLQNNFLEVNDIQFYNHIPVFLFFIFILFLSVKGRRFWCKSLCPLGALYALTAKISLLKRHVDTDKCTSCLACVNACRTNAIYSKGTETHEGECIKCFECLEACKFDAIKFNFYAPFTKKKKSSDKDAEKNSPENNITFTRKNLLWSAAVSVLAVPVFKRKPVFAKNHSRLIRPPGALDEQDFINKCIRCGQCMKVCPTNGLHPQLFEYGADGIFTPRLIPRIGWCEKNCNQCSSVCPSGALEKVPISKKETTVIGTAYILKDFCIPWSDFTDCLVCEEMCPTEKKAIIFKEQKLENKKGETVTVKLPYVLEDICIGCGICENKCPVKGEAAIQVHRPRNVSAGPYGA
ncbi:MAG: 4Fe-4S binding protein [Spirochaetes bacterium]|nr:4Fe-4S binding protein [Spirochaetota bacterium]